MDMIPPVTLLILNSAVTVSLFGRRDELVHWRLVLLCALAPALYGLGGIWAGFG